MLSQLLFLLTGLPLFEDGLFRAGASALFSGLLVLILMPWVIRLGKRLNATSDFNSSEDTPSILGGMLLVPVVVLATLCFSHPTNTYVLSTLIILVAFFFIGAIDDIAKVWNKRRVIKGLISKKEYQNKADGISARLRLSLYFIFSFIVAVFAYKFVPNMDGHLTIPFIKPSVWFPYLPNWAFLLLICFVITSTANGANFTDGLDSLVAIPIITTSLFVGIIAYISANSQLTAYFLIPHLPGIDELFILCSAISGALGAYLWFNSPPAQIYMGDSGSIGFGGAIGMMFIFIKAELFLPIVGFIFLSEALSVFLQIGWFKFTRATHKDKTGKRLFLRAPIHHHFQLLWKDKYKNNLALNSKIVWRFHMISIFCFLLGLLIFIKVR